jgi:hypothetical protein
VTQTSTHDLTVGATEVRKRFVEWDRGEADREWACLTVLTEHAPGLAPRPLRRETEDGAPVVVMERLPGVPLGEAPTALAQTAALGAALRRLYAVPPAAVREAGIGERRYGLREQPAVVATCRLVDFEDAGLSDPAYELADHIEHLAGRLIGGYDADALVDAVGLDAAARERISAYRPLWAGFWLAMLLPGNGGWQRNPPGTTEDQARRVLALVGNA